MNISLLDEPELEFGNGGTHVDVRFGIMQHGPLDRGTDLAPRQLKVGLVGTQDCVEKLHSWFTASRDGVAAKGGRLGNLFPRFPGFSTDTCFDAELVFHDRWCAHISKRELDAVLSAADPGEQSYRAVDLFLAHARQITEQGGPLVVVCAPSQDLLGALEYDRQQIDPTEAELDEGGEEQPFQPRRPAFHDVLKARAMDLGVPTQMVRPDTYASVPGRRARKKNRRATRPLQDEATRAWNIHTALYYKAGGIPWRLVRRAADLTTCFVGISFFRSESGDRMLTSVAQVFNERGEGVIVKGAQAELDKDDRQPHLKPRDASILLESAIRTYRSEHRNQPARVVIHKTSRITSGERDGFSAAVKTASIELLELLTLRRSYTRLFRNGRYPPLRGTFLSLDSGRAILYLRGSVQFFQVYPGMYVPRPLEFIVDSGEASERTHAEEMLALSKLNWNNTQFDGGEPITVRAARRVGDILKRVPEGGVIQPSFRYFM